MATFAFAQVTFTTEKYSSGPNGTSSMVNGDFNNDGILDLVTINAGTLSFFKGIGGGKFDNTPTNQTIPQNIGYQVYAADFNRDGKIDLAIATSSNGPSYATILLGNGDGTFTQGTNLQTAGLPFLLAVADFNGDHIPDIAASPCPISNGQCSTQVFLGNGDGTFTESASLSDGGGPIVAGDFNADGHQDLALMTGSTLLIYLGDGNGTFQAPVSTILTYAGVSLVVGDFYNNRIQSLAVLSGNYNDANPPFFIQSARFSNGAISMTSPQQINTFWYYNFVASGDLNGDFKDDVVVTGGQKFGGGALAVYMLGNGDGTFQTAVNLGSYGETFLMPQIRDVNRDSRHDIVAPWSNGYAAVGGGAYIWLNTNATQNCAPPKPNALSVHVCAPANGQVVGKTFTFRAAGNAFNGVAKRMELWIDGKKVGQNLEDQLRVTPSLSRGAHTASFVVVDTFDQHVSGSVSFTSSY